MLDSDPLTPEPEANKEKKKRRDKHQPPFEAKLTRAAALEATV